MNLVSVDSATKTATDGVLTLIITADLGDGAGNQSMPYGWVPGDPHGLGPAIDAYMTAHPSIAQNAAAVPAPSTNPADYVLRRYQFLAMLTLANLASLVAPAIASISDPVQRAVAQAKFDSTQTFQRDDPTLNLLTDNAGLSSAQVDSYWLQAKDL